MTDVTYDKAAGAEPAQASVVKTGRKGFWQGAFDAMVQARMRQAARLVQEYRDLAQRP